MVSIGQLDSRSRPFRFFNVWCNHSEFHNLVSGLWQELGGPGLSLWVKFNHLREKVRGWQPTKYLNSVSRNMECESELASLLCSPLPQSLEDLENFASKKKEIIGVEIF